MFAQFPPELSQSRHWYAYVIGESPAQLPLDAVSVCVSWSVPEIEGSAVFAGAPPNRIVPFVPAAQQAPAVGQEIAFSWAVEPDVSAVHVEPPLDVKTMLPLAPTAQHWVVVGQEIA
jgi:hypothetical protein